jgi:predicted transcriptional regulator
MMVRCLECNKLMSDMRAHLRKHKMTPLEYAAKHGVSVRTHTQVRPTDKLGRWRT